MALCVGLVRRLTYQTESYIEISCSRCFVLLHSAQTKNERQRNEQKRKNETRKPNLYSSVDLLPYTTIEQLFWLTIILTFLVFYSVCLFMFVWIIKKPFSCDVFRASRRGSFY
jgi:hypothetical protein